MKKTLKYKKGLEIQTKEDNEGKTLVIRKLKKNDFIIQEPTAQEIIDCCQEESDDK